MKTNARITAVMQTAFLLLLMSLPAGITAQNPHAPVPVEPGVKGTLPAVPELSQLESGRFTALWLDYVAYDNTLGSTAYLHFYSPEDRGGEYYTLQMTAHGSDSWQTVKSSTGDNRQFTGLSAWVNISYTTDFRLVMHGGEMDGYISNVITVHPSLTSVRTYRTGWSEDGIQTPFVGHQLNRTYSIIVTVRDDKGNETQYDQTSGYFKYQWYRRNPNTWEMTPIAGATQWNYTPTLDDAGYVLIQEIQGDDVHCSFTQWHFASEWDYDITHVCVEASPAYYGDDGFILNTSYVIPDVGEMLGVKQGSMYAPVEPMPECVITEPQPGQYAFHLSHEAYNYLQYDFRNPAYMLTFLYGHQGDDIWYREAQVMRDRLNVESFSVRPVFAGRTLPTTVDIIGPDIDGNLVVKASREYVEGGESDVIQFGFDDEISYLSKYYIKARKTGSTLDTYYPSALIWSNATAVDLTPIYDQETYETRPMDFVIDVKEVPEVLTGTGVIEGTVAALSSAAQARADRMNAPAGETDTYTIYLMRKDAGIVATTQTDAAGNYRFENVPFGSWFVLVNIDGCTQEQSVEVTLTETQPTATGIDYSISDDGTILPSGAMTIAGVNAAGSVTGVFYSVDGRKGRTRGLNIVRMSDGTVRKVLVK